MLFKELTWLWQLSGKMFGDSNKKNFRLRVKFMLKALFRLNTLKIFLHPVDSGIKQLMDQRPETVGAVLWPYQCISWNAETRLQKIQAHYIEVKSRFPQLNFPINGALELLDLNDVFEGLHIVLDQPIWFMREGQLTLNLFLGDLRVFSLAFSFENEAGQLIVNVGAMQGRNIDGLLEIYKELTKALHGMRPRDLLFELFRALCRALDVKKIYAVTDAKRHHRDPYFGKAAKAERFTLNYDEIWQERGGHIYSEDFYMFDVNSPVKNLEDVPSKKRAMYRRRYEFLDDIESRMQQVCSNMDHQTLLKCPFYYR